MHQISPARSISFETKIIVEITAFITPENFWVAYAPESFHNFNAKLQVCYENPPERLQSIFSGMHCAVRCGKNDNWYRASILDINHDNCKVLYVDTGVMEMVSVLEVFPLLEEIVDVPCQAVNCALDNIKAIEGDGWRRSYETLFQNWVHLEAVFHNARNDVYDVSLFPTLYRKHFSLTDCLINLGWAELRNPHVPGEKYSKRIKSIGKNMVRIVQRDADVKKPVTKSSEGKISTVGHTFRKTVDMNRSLQTEQYSAISCLRPTCGRIPPKKADFNHASHADLDTIISYFRPPFDQLLPVYPEKVGKHGIQNTNKDSLVFDSTPISEDIAGNSRNKGTDNNFGKTAVKNVAKSVKSSQKTKSSCKKQQIKILSREQELNFNKKEKQHFKCMCKSLCSAESDKHCHAADNVYTSPKPLKLPEKGKAVPIRVGWVTDPSEFYITFKENIKTDIEFNSAVFLYEAVQKHCMDITGSNPNMKMKKCRKLPWFERGKQVAVFSSCKQRWCRAVIVSPSVYSPVDSKHKVSLFYPDSGYRDCANVDDLRELPMHVYKIPFQAVKCCLKGVKPCSGGTWSSEAVRAFKKYVSADLMATIENFENDVLVVALKMNIEDEIINIGELLLELGFAEKKVNDNV